jgi:hypothetical protein
VNLKRPRPAFKSANSATVHASPEELFYKLSGRASSHGYLRGPQQDVLREYMDQHSGVSDAAFELPTGTGKTAVGLLVAEWKRLPANRVAYLSLTNQLAGQVLAEAARLGVACADLRGTKETRSSAEEGRYKTGSAIGVTTYSNLFNSNPVVKEAEFLAFDDAHGAEHYVSDMWTVSADLAKEESLYNSLLAALRPGMSESQIRSVLDKSAVGSVELADVQGHPECISNVIAVLDAATADTAKYAWRFIRPRIQSCLFLVSPNEIAIRPLLPPTHTHGPFAAAKQRIYMSATLGGESDLQRAYGIQKLRMIRARSPQWGRRYVFVPGIYSSDAEAVQVVASVWDGMDTRRAVLLAPSDRIKSRTFDALENAMIKKPARCDAADIANTMDAFVNSTDVILALAARYDGLDLPDEQCRLLLMSETPAAVNLLERHLSERWKMGPVLKKRERTRLTQGMGRCTRNATDFAVIVWLGQSLVNAASSASFLNGLPPELSAEVRWGVSQSELAAKSADQLVSMILALMDDPEYRKQADADIAGLEKKHPEGESPDYEEAGADEVRYAKAMWDENFQYALETAHRIADQLNSPELAGYRAWWWYLASIAASLVGEQSAEQDALQRGARCGINSGWLNQLLRKRKAALPARTDGIEPNAESLWDVLAGWGWAGPKFEHKIGQMLEQLAEVNAVSYHEGLEILGSCFGAAPTRTTEDGAPDVVWSFLTDDVHIAFEAKTEKKVSGVLSKKEVQEAKGHSDWIREYLAHGGSTAEIATIVVAPSAALHQIALPFAGGLFYVGPETVFALAKKVADSVRKLRIRFSGQDFPGAAAAFSAEMRNMGLDISSIKKALLSDLLKE